MPRYSVNPGEMRTKITMQSPTISIDAGAAQVTTFASVSRNPVMYARWVNVHGAETATDDALKSTQRAHVTIRHRTDIDTTWRVIKDDGSAWNIISIDTIRGERRFLELLVERTKGTS